MAQMVQIFAKILLLLLILITVETILCRKLQEETRNFIRRKFNILFFDNP